MKRRAEFYNAPERGYAWHPMPGNALGNPTHYYRLLSDCSARLNIEGKAVEIDCPEVYEAKL